MQRPVDRSRRLRRPARAVCGHGAVEGENADFIVSEQRFGTGLFDRREGMDLFHADGGVIRFFVGCVEEVLRLAGTTSSRRFFSYARSAEEVVHTRVSGWVRIAH